MRHHLRSERVLRGGKRGARVYRDFATEGIVQHIKRLLVIKENQILQLKKFGTFLHMGSSQSLDSLKSSFDVHLSSLVSSGIRVGRGCSLRAARAVILFFPQFPQATGSHCKAAVADHVTSLFTDIAGNISISPNKFKCRLFHLLVPLL